MCHRGCDIRFVVSHELPDGVNPRLDCGMAVGIAPLVLGQQRDGEQSEVDSKLALLPHKVCGLACRLGVQIDLLQEEGRREFVAR